MARAALRVAIVALVVGGAVVAILAVAWLTRPAPLVAPPDELLVGVHLDGAVDTPQDFAARTGVTPRVLGDFVEFPIPTERRADLDTLIAAAARDDAVLLLTLEPLDGLEVVTRDAARDLAGFLHEVNAAGVPVLLRFGHEMNGSWYPWGQDPDAYVAAFRTIAREVHRATDATAMLWAPNHGGGYPFGGGEFTARPGTDAFEALDTDRDGQLTAADDPYAPYYPGDRWVDWVGLTLYHWGDAYPWGTNDVPEPRKFLAQVTGTYLGPGRDETGLPDFHDQYAAGRGKPMAVAETAAFFNTEAEGDEVAVKIAWLDQVFDPGTAARLPGLRMIVWFEQSKPEPEVEGALVDWRVSHHDGLAAAFRDRVEAWRAAR
jgi:hypothetical protein